ncbi:LLM class flavin-dependent oxidoreductase [Streptomyces sp. NPDC053079]|uniref:LLM class flavin-dependent oxidoreductase n=1 Tax=Streptomyces sp. NPDC053079 TaxID=3365697 RepID=UPI0037D3868C
MSPSYPPHPPAPARVPLRVGVLILPTGPWRESEHAWRLAEDLGLAHAWTFDHIAWRDLSDAPWYAAVPTLAAAARATSRIALGTLVSSPNFRHPVTLAKDFIALDDLSDGRMVLGLGAGAPAGTDATVLGPGVEDPRLRHERFAEFVELTDRLLTQHRTTHHGRHYTAQDARMTPGCRQQPRMPLAVAAAGPRALRVAARHADIWVTNGHSPGGGRLAPVAEDTTLARQITAFTRACAHEDRPPSAMRRLLLDVNRAEPPLRSAAAFEERAHRCAALGFTDLVIPFPRTQAPFKADLRVLERIACQVLPHLPPPAPLPQLPPVKGTP